MKNHISLGSFAFHLVLWFFVFCFFFFGGRAEAALMVPTPKSHTSSLSVPSVPEVYIADTLPSVSLPNGVGERRKKYTLHGIIFPDLFIRYQIKVRKVFCYQVVWRGVVWSGDSDIVLWQQWSGKDGIPMAALLRQDGGGYTVARNAYVDPHHGIPDTDGMALLQAKLLSEEIPDDDAIDKKMGDKGVFAVEDFYYKVEMPQKKRFSL